MTAPVDCPHCAASRAAERKAFDLITDYQTAFSAVLEYADECRQRPGAQLAALTVAAAIHSALAATGYKPRPCLGTCEGGPLG